MVGRNILHAIAFAFVVTLALAMIASVSADDEAVLTPDTARLAILAGTMREIAENGDGAYTLDCGRGKFDTVEDVLNLMPKETQDIGDYCILKKSDKVLFGTYGDGVESDDAKDILTIFKDTNYKSQFTKTTDIKDTACNLGSGITLLPEFQECKGALNGLHTYVAYDSSESGAVYILVGDSALNAFATDEGFFDSIIAFFANLFGETSSEELALSQQEFHHAYYARQGDLLVTASWMDSTAIIAYENFSTDIGASRPIESGFEFGHGHKQVMTLELDPDDEDDLAQWRRLTAGLSVKDTGKPPIEGDVCGNNKAGADENCDGTDMPITTCRAYNSLYSTGNLGCFAKGTASECMYDTKDCISCDDADKDGYSGGEGAKGAFVTITNTFSIGTARPEGPFTDALKDKLNARTRALQIKYEMLPVTFDMLFPKDSNAANAFAAAVAKAETDYAACIAGYSNPSATDKDECVDTAYKEATFATATGYATQNMLNWQAPVTADLCSPSAGGISCPDGFSPVAAGITERYSQIFPALNRMDVTPIIQITLGTCDSKDACGMFAYSADSNPAWKSMSGLPTNIELTEVNLRKIRAYCQVLAQGTASYWSGLTDYQDADSVPSHYVVIGDPTRAKLTADEYKSIYLACKSGIESDFALSEGATVLYALPSDIVDVTNSATLSTNPSTQSIISAPALFDGVYLEQKINGDAYATPSADSIAKMNALLAILKKPVYARMTGPATASQLFSSALPAMHAESGTTTFIYDDANVADKKLTKIFMNGETPSEDLRPITRYWQAVIEGLGTPAFAWDVTQPFSNGQKLPAGVDLIGANRPENKANLTFFNRNSVETTVTLPLTGCAVQQATFITETESKSGPFNGKLPAHSIVQVPLNKNLSCLYPSARPGDAAACKTIVDCNDTNSNINPGKTEVCGNGFDDNWDSRID